MAKLLIVESQAKVKTIQSFSREYVAAACMGHIRDLCGDKTHKSGVDVENGFAPIYRLDPNKRKVVENLRKLSQGKHVLLASDMDREGEAIAESLREVLGLKDGQYSRVLFNEITKKAVLEALKKPTVINRNMVDAQLARRVLDRLVGFELSPLLAEPARLSAFTPIGPVAKTTNWHKLGTGRVQSVAVRLVVEREAEIAEFFERVSGGNASSLFSGSGLFKFGNGNDGPETVKWGDLSADLHTPDRKLVYVEDREKAEECMRNLVDSSWKVESMSVKDSFAKPAAPFITSTLQQEAGSRLHFSVKRTMDAAQKLYENSLITYMRTDSLTISDDAMNNLRDYVVSEFGNADYQYQQYRTKSKTAQEAHEAIRPTDVSKSCIGTELSGDCAALYKLIWERTVASQMRPAKYVVLELTLVGRLKNGAYWAGHPPHMVGQIRLLHTPGHMKAGRRDIKSEIDDKGVDAYRSVGWRKLEPVMTWAKLAQKLKSPPSRFNEALLVKKLEELEIGRPSTYASIISKVQKHDYVEITDVSGREVRLTELIWEGGAIENREKTCHWGRESNRLVPTNIGNAVNGFLKDKFPLILDYEFTSKMERSLDGIANGELVWNRVLGDFYQVFKKLVQDHLRSRPAMAVRNGDVPPSWKFQFEVEGHQVYLGVTKYGPALILKGGAACALPVPTVAASVTQQQTGSNDGNEGNGPDPPPSKHKVPTIKLKKRPNPPSSIRESGAMRSATGGTAGKAHAAPHFIDWKNKPPPTVEEVTEILRKMKAGIGNEERNLVGTVGKYSIRTGPHGNYVEESGTRVSLPGKISDLTEDAVSGLIAEKKNQFIKEVDGYQVRRGKHGPYIMRPSKTKKGKPSFYKIPEGLDPNELTGSQITDIVKRSKSDR